MRHAFLLGRGNLLYAIELRRAASTAGLVMLLLPMGSCGDGSVTETDIRTIPWRDYSEYEPPLTQDASLDRGAAAPDAGSAADTTPPPSQDLGPLPGPGEPCRFWECAEGAVCFMGTCRKQCKQAVPNCNDEVAACEQGQACIPGASSFSDVCYPAEAGLNEPCGPANGDQCLPGLLCVIVDNEPARCLKLCKYGCPADQTTQCEETGNGCPVCVPYP